MKHSLIWLCFALLSISPAFSSVINVPGSSGTISGALTMAVPGDTVIVHEGTYVEIINLPAGVVLGSLYLLDGDENHIANTTIEAPPFIGPVVTINSLAGRDTRISGLSVNKGEYYLYSVYEAGGGIHVDGGSPVLDHLIVEDNNADYGGGIGLIYSNAIVQHCKVLNNEAAVRGGGIYVLGGAPIIYGCEIGGNDGAYDGGGLYFHDGFTKVINCTITGNTVQWAGAGGQAFYCWANGYAEITNCILRNGGTNEIDATTSYPASGANILYCDIEGGTSGIYPLSQFAIGAGIIDAVPQFVNGPFTNYALASTSPCIDVGDASFMATLDTDVELNPVIGSAPDLGANEYGVSSICNAPTGLISMVGAGSVNLSWNAVPNADGYQVQGWPSGTSSIASKITTGTSLTISLALLSPNTDFEWQVRARCQPGNSISLFSEIQNFTTPALKIAQKEDNQLVVTPNLCSSGDLLHIAYGYGKDLEFYIIDQFGKVLLNSTLENGNVIISLRSFSPGIYYVLLAEDNSVKPVPFVVLDN